MSPIPMSQAAPEKEPSSNAGAGSEATKLETLSTQKNNVHEFRKAFDDNMRNKPVYHDKTFVLLLSWADELDDLGVKHEVDQLQAAFTDGYGFGVTRKRLESPKPLQQLRKFLGDFIYKNDGADTLLIIYYAGHGRYEGKPTREPGIHWEAKGSPPSATERERNSIAWSAAENCITNTAGDVLVIFDCCNAGGFGGHKVRASPMSNFEFIAACGIEEVAAVPGESSFTQALMWALDDLKKQGDYPFMSSTLVERIKQCPQLYKNQTPELRRREGTVWLAPLNMEKVGKQGQPHSERRKSHGQYIDLRLHFYRSVTPVDAQNVAQHLSDLVNDKDTFAKHIELLDVSSSISKYVAKWVATANNKKRKRRASTFSTDVSLSPTSITNHVLSDSITNQVLSEMELVTGPVVKRIRLDEPEQPPGPLYHLRMFFASSLRWMATRVRPPSTEFPVVLAGRGVTSEQGEQDDED